MVKPGCDNGPDSSVPGAAPRDSRAAGEGALADQGGVHQILDLVPVALVVTDVRGCVVWMNRATEALLGTDTAAVTGRRAVEILASSADRDQASHFFEPRDEIPAEPPHPIQCELRAADGVLHTVVWRAVQRLDAGGAVAGHLCVGEDVTEALKMRAQLAQSDRMATVGMLAAGVAHEINNPLTSILFNLQIVVDDIPRLLEAVELLRQALQEHAGIERTEQLLQPYKRHVGVEAVLEFKACVEEATLAAERVRDIVRDLKVFSRVDDDKLVMLDVRGPIETAISMSYHEIKYRARLLKDLPWVPGVLGNDGRLAQVFLNLLINAAQAIQEGDAKNQQICVRTRSAAGLVEISFSDTGQGIAPEHLTRVFEPFFTTKPPGIGSGLGLAICKNIIESMGGRIEVHSELGKGTTFNVKLPVGPRVVPGKGSTVVAARPDVPRARVLVIDDDLLMRSVLQRLLGSEHDVVVMESGQKALQLLEEDKSFEVILCDVMMPTVTGVEVFDQITRRHPELVARFIFMTGGIFTPHTRESLKLSQCPTIEKPFNAQHLRQLVSDTVARARSPSGRGG